MKTIGIFTRTIGDRTENLIEIAKIISDLKSRMPDTTIIWNIFCDTEDGDLLDRLESVVDPIYGLYKVPAPHGHYHAYRYALEFMKSFDFIISIDDDDIPDVEGIVEFYRQAVKSPANMYLVGVTTRWTRYRKTGELSSVKDTYVPPKTGVMAASDWFYGRAATVIHTPESVALLLDDPSYSNGTISIELDSK